MRTAPRQCLVDERLTVYTFPSRKFFIDLLARFVLRADRGALVLLPTRRACVSLREACLNAAGGIPHLLPRIRPLGDMEEEEIFAETWMEDALDKEGILPPVSSMQRHVLLAALVTEHLKIDMEQALLLAQALARLLDAAEREELSLSDLSALVPEALASHWQITLRVLQPIAVEWPERLAEAGYMEPVLRRNAMLRRLAALWEKNPPAYPVIVAGSTGSLPATAAFLKTVSRMAQGSVILPALDLDASEEVWRQIEESHPQFGLKKLLERLELSRSSIKSWDDEAVPDNCPDARVDLLQAALLPAGAVNSWRDLELSTASALSGVGKHEAETPQEEAQTIALSLREVLETPGKRAAVITHDRVLARRVAAALRRMDIEIDDAAGRPLLSVEQGVYLKLVAEAAQSQAAPVPLLALLKHPLSACGMEPAECRNAARLLEIQALRGIRPVAGFSQVKHSVEKESPAAALIAELEEALGEFMRALHARALPFSRLLALHLGAAERIANAAAEPGAARLWAGPEGQALAEAVLDLWSTEGLGVIEPSQYPALFATLLSGATYHRAYGMHPRLHILSPAEARLQRYDRVILAGLNEDCWPPSPEVSPWMSRPMQREFGLPLPERSVGMSAHDFFVLSASPEVIFTRARRIGGTDAAPSRFLLRLDALLHSLKGKPHVWPVMPYAAWAKQAPPALPPIAPPMPAPPLSARPRRLNVTEIETLLRDPYAVYARHILHLKKLDPLDQEPTAREMGIVIHDALRRFTLRRPDASLETLLECGEEALAAFGVRPAARAFWQPRLAAIAEWITAQERQRRPQLAALYAECSGEWTWAATGGAFTLATRIDRLEIGKDGKASIIDYKTGGVPSMQEILRGPAMQLPLEACVLREGKINGLKHAPSDISGLEYWKLGGAKNEILNLSAKTDIETLIAEARARLMELVAAFDDAHTPYLALPRPAIAPRYNVYRHLERPAEWEEA